MDLLKSLTTPEKIYFYKPGRNQLSHSLSKLIKISYRKIGQMHPISRVFTMLNETLETFENFQKKNKNLVL